MRSMSASTTSFSGSSPEWTDSMEGALLIILMIWLLVIIKAKEKEEVEQEPTDTFDAELLRKDIARLYDLSQEMDSLKGLFAGMKRKKLQKQIDELNEQLRRL